MITRRNFIAGAGASAGLGVSGCRLFAERGASRCRSSAYWCTWATQGDTRLRNGASSDRDNLNERTVFGKDGWINLYPEHRRDLLFMVDDGWDVPYGAKGGPEGIHSFGSLVPDRERFPSLGVNASDRDRLREFARRTEDAGWKGLGVWVACQAHRERFEAPFPMEHLKEDLRRKLDEAAYAGVRYWKVDWGVHNFHVWYRRLMSELKERYYPELIVDHARGFNNALNGSVDPYLKPADEYQHVGRTGRILGVSEFDPVTRDCEEILSFSDVFRTYDSAHPLTTATMLERAVWELHAADKSSSRVVINTEDEPLIAAGLGLELSMMRCPWVPEPKVCRVRPRHRRMAEDSRCLVWQRIAEPFGSDTPARTLHSEASIRESWRFIPDECWFTGAREASYYQVAPACVTRGLALPSVKGEGGEVPYVLGSRHPNGALAFAALPLLDPVRMSYTPKAEVRFDAALEPGVPVAAFGRFGTIVMNDLTGGGRVLARDLLGGETVDLTPKCVREAGRIVLPGDELAEIGAAMNPEGDDSAPGAIVEVA